jgi:hypothetical protein
VTGPAFLSELGGGGVSPAAPMSNEKGGAQRPAAAAAVHFADSPPTALGLSLPRLATYPGALPPSGASPDSALVRGSSGASAASAAGSVGSSGSGGGADSPHPPPLHPMDSRMRQLAEHNSEMVSQTAGLLMRRACRLAATATQ